MPAPAQVSPQAAPVPAPPAIAPNLLLAQRAPSAPLSVPGLGAQLVTVLSPLRAAPDGTQQLTIALSPAGLGQVQVHLEATGDAVSVRLWASTASGHEALRQSLPELRQQLSGGAPWRSQVQLAGWGGQAPAGFGHPGSGAGQPGAGQPGGGSPVPQPGPPEDPRQVHGLPESSRPATGAAARLVDIHL
ncbi:MAG: flagellar hook-length control protein FliK [Acidimicrobiales bacterium]